MLILLRCASARLGFATACRSLSAVPKTWGKPAEGHTFNSHYPTEFRQSQIYGAGNGWYAKVDIPGGTCLRRVSVADGTLLRFESLEEIETAGWDFDETVNYGIGHHSDSSAIYFLNPGTAMNHSDSSREASVIYSHKEKDVFELWTVKDIKAGEEMFNAYHVDFGPCAWYDEHHRSRGNIPISQLNDEIEAIQEKLQKKFRLETRRELMRSV